MKEHIEELLREATSAFAAKGDFSIRKDTAIHVERTRENQHGEYASNIAMKLAKQAGMKPRQIAEQICSLIPESDYINKIEVAGPGFLNFFLDRKAYLQTIIEILEKGHTYGHSASPARIKVLIEFVSANPTGPIHIGHGRGAAYGDTLANLLEATGLDVTREYYVNDSGRQMDILAVSILMRYLQQCGEDYPFPENAYQADYINDIAGQIFSSRGRDLKISLADLYKGNRDKTDQEQELDLLIAYARNNLGKEKFEVFFRAGLETILNDIKEDLEQFGVRYDNWFSEQSLQENNLIDVCLDKLIESGEIYEQGGAKWFNSSKYGDEKDRVVVRENGVKTYFASDIAYHKNKFDRGFDRIIDIWGADHHGYIKRVKGSLTALGQDPDAMDVLLVQFATLYRGGEKIQMSTRSGQYITLRELRQEVGNDAARFFYVSRKCEQHLDFDLDLAKSQSNDNPVYYIQYAHARICSVIEQMQERGLMYNRDEALKNLSGLAEEHETNLLRNLSKFPEIILAAAERYEPHQIGFYLRDVANDFHSYYNSHQFLIEDDTLRQARISLILATRQVIQNGLKILGVSAPEKM